jgi:hypothetical protein
MRLSLSLGEGNLNLEESPTSYPNFDTANYSYINYDRYATILLNARSNMTGNNSSDYKIGAIVLGQRICYVQRGVTRANGY